MQVILPVLKQNRKVPNFDKEDDNIKTSLENKHEVESTEGAISKNTMDDYDKLMSSVMEGDQEPLDDGGIVKDLLNQNLSSFSPNMMFEHLVKDYKNAENIYGESMLQQITGESSDALEKNIKFPEYQKEIQQKIRKKSLELRQKGLLNKEMEVTDKGYSMASLSLYVQELDKITPEGMIGKHESKDRSFHGAKGETKIFKKGDRYRDLAIKRSIKLAVRRGHNKIQSEDLRAFERTSRGEQNIIYALDASGSMKGSKVDVCKKAGVALAYHAIENNDKVGLIVFGEDVKDAIRPTSDFNILLRSITRIKASKETDMSSALDKAIELFPTQADITKHLLILTDALPTSGEDPYKETLEEVSKARAAGITISIVGINLDEDGKEFAKKIVETGEGKFYRVNDTDEVDQIVLTDYYDL